MQKTLGERLRDALTYWGRGHRAFAREMEGLKIRGASYRSLVNYLGDKTKPSGMWVRQAANILGVEEKWLLDGEGPMLPEDAAAPEGVPAPFDLVDLFRAVMPLQLCEIILTHSPWVIAGGFWPAFMGLCISLPDRGYIDSIPAEERIALGRVLVDGALATLSGTGSGAREDWDHDAIASFFMQYWGAVYTARSGRNKGPTYDELIANAKKEFPSHTATAKEEFPSHTLESQ